MENAEIATGSQKFVARVIYYRPRYKELKVQFPGDLSIDPRYVDVAPTTLKEYRHVSRESRELVFEFFRVVHYSSTKSVLAKMGSSGLRPALYEELLCFDKAYPKLQFQHKIIALGSAMRIHGNNWYPCADEFIDQRTLSLWYPCRDTGHKGAFLAVRE